MASLTWNRRRAAHLYRRAGFGGLPGELDAAVAAGREATVDRLVNFASISTDELNERLTTFGFDLTSWFQPGTDPRGQQFNQLLRWWSLRMTYTPRPLEEKITLFWHGHFATSNAKLDSPVMLYKQNQILRTMGMGRFGELLMAVSKDPAMLLWLDNATNVKGAPNENFARELMELFTMGRGHYTENDVKESARALTGWTITGDRDVDYVFMFDNSRHDSGLKIFLGRAGYFRGEDIITILVGRPETASYITRKLARYFLGDEPREGLARRLADVYFATDGDIRSIVREILMSDDFDETADRSEMIKSPTEFLIGALRATDFVDDGLLELNLGATLGQFLFVPPNVSGWKGGRDWINTGAYLSRLHAMVSVNTDRDGLGFGWDDQKYFGGRDFESPDALIDFLVDRLNMIDISPKTRQAVRNFLALMGDPFVWNRDQIGRFGSGAMHLLMASPEYQMQ